MTYEQVRGRLIQLTKSKHLDAEEKAAVRYALTAVALIYKLHPALTKKVEEKKRD